MKNAKTTIFGAIAALGSFFATSTTGALQVVGQVISGLATFLLGAAAQDAPKKN